MLGVLEGLFSPVGEGLAGFLVLIAESFDRLFVLFHEFVNELGVLFV